MSKKSHSKTDNKWPLLRLSQFAYPYRWQLLLGLCLMFTVTLVSLVPAYLIMPLTDNILVPLQNGQSISFSQASPYLLGLFGAAVLAWGLGWARTYTLAWVSERIGFDLRMAAFKRLVSLSHQYFTQVRTGDLISRIGNETDRINIFLSSHLLNFIKDFLVVLLTIVTLLFIDVKLALISLAPIPLIMFNIQYIRSKLRVGFEQCDRNFSPVINILSDTIRGIRVVKCFAQEQQEIKRFKQANRNSLHSNDRMNKVWSLFSPTTSALTDLGLLVIWIAGIWLLTKHQITLGLLTAFIAYITRCYTCFESMSSIVSFTQRASVSTKRIFEILDRESSVIEAINPIKRHDFRGEIMLQDVNFYYGNKQVLTHINIHIKPQERVCLVGHSGAGKSTLINLICRFYDPTFGVVLSDGIDIRQFKTSDYRKNIGVVLQDSFLFYGSIADNIAYGNPKASLEQIIDAARAARAHEFILKQPLGYDTIIHEGGHSLSGGEKQRISIARAILINPKILILDEATSSVDNKTEHEIKIAMANLIQGRTTIAITHRLSSLDSYDRLIVLKNGHIVEEGTHSSLIAQKGYYFELYNEPYNESYKNQLDKDEKIL